MSELLAPVVFLVTDTASHPVAGAVVQIFQTVSAWQAACPDKGRCPIAPVYGSSVSPVTSEENGLVTVTPQQIAGVCGSYEYGCDCGDAGVCVAVAGMSSHRSVEFGVDFLRGFKKGTRG